MRSLAVALLGLGAVAAHAQVRDVGRFGPTCPVPAHASDGRPARLTLPARPLGPPAPTAPGLPRASEVTRRVVALRGTALPGTPAVVAVVGTDPESLAVVRRLPRGSLVLVLPPADAADRAQVGRACPACRVGPGRAESAQALGVRAYPAVLRLSGRAIEITEGVAP
jgi:hypothetical protein